MSVRFWRRPFSGRSSVVAENIVATSQPLASEAGLRMIVNGGNAIDAAVAAAAVLNVVEPFSTGIGGDAFALVFVPGEKSPRALNGSGPSPRKLTYDYLVEELKLEKMPIRGMEPITVPGAVSLWCELHEKYGSLALEEVLSPAIKYAEEGFHVSPVISQVWGLLEKSLQSYQGLAQIYFPAPTVGERVANPALANTFKLIAKNGADEFYKGSIATSIADFMEKNEGFITEKDLSDFKAEWTTPIRKEFYGHNLWEHGPNGQGIITQLILSIAQELDIESYPHNSVDYLHLLIEAKKLAFIDGFQYIADPDDQNVPVDFLLSEEYSMKRASVISPTHAMEIYSEPITVGEDTVYLTAADKDGLVVSFINSLFYGFGSAVADPITGIVFQCRGAGFSLVKDHPNQYKPGKRPYHTIIPAMITDSNNELKASFGVMGGHHQPQGQVQVFLNLILHKMDPQRALDSPRFHHEQLTNKVALESPIDIGVKAGLRARGHSMMSETMTGFGGGQIIMYDSKNDCYIAGSSSRKDGCAIGF